MSRDSDRSGRQSDFQDLFPDRRFERHVGFAFYRAALGRAELSVAALHPTMRTRDALLLVALTV
jgi:hypothetical protein